MGAAYFGFQASKIGATEDAVGKELRKEHDRY